MAIAVTPRSVGLMLAATAVAGWFETSTMPNAQAPQQTSSRAAAARLHDLRSTDTSIPSTDRLRQRMTPPAVPTRGRNPFVYGSRSATRSSVAGDGGGELAPVATVEPIAPAAPALPVFRLSGIAANLEGGVTVLTAIIIDNGTMVFAKAGDKLSRGYSVTKVDEQSITLVDAEGVTQTIRLP